MPRMLIFGMGYCTSRLAQRLRAEGWEVIGTRREARDGALAFDDGASVLAGIGAASLQWSGYLSATGVYGDADGAWVDESAPIGFGRRKARSEADQRWQALRDDMHVFRLPGIYGPGRSPLDRVREGKASRIDMPGQVFSRIHVDDIVSAVIASFDGPAGVYNISDDLPAPQHEIVAHAARLLGMDVPPLQSLEEAALSEAALGFYAENRRVANGRAKRLLGWAPRYPDYKAGMQALLD